MNIRQPTPQLKINNIRTLDSYIDEEPQDYISEQVTQNNQEATKLVREIKQNIKQNDDLLYPSYLQDAETDVKIPEDCDFEQFDQNMQNTIDILNNQIVGADRYSSIDAQTKVLTDSIQIPKQQSVQAKNLLYNQKPSRIEQFTQKPKPQTLDSILDQSIGKIKNISIADVDTTDSYFQNAYDDGYLAQDNENQYENHQNIEQEDEMDEKQQNQYLQQQYPPAQRNPRLHGLQTTSQKFDSFQHVCHRIGAMRNNVYEQKYVNRLKTTQAANTRATSQNAQRQSMYRSTATPQRFSRLQSDYDIQKSTNIAASRHSIAQSIQKSAKWLNSNLQVDVTPVSFKTRLFAQNLQQQPQAQRNLSVQKPNSTQQFQKSASRLFSARQKPVAAQKTCLTQHENKGGFRTPVTHRSESLESEVRQIDERISSQKAASRRSSFGSDDLGVRQRANKPAVQKYNQIAEQSIKQGMRNNILDRQLRIQQPKQSDTVYYRQMLQKQLAEQKTEQERLKQQKAQQNASQCTFTPRINERPAYLDSVKRTQSRDDGFFRAQQSGVSSPVRSANERLQRQKPVCSVQQAARPTQNISSYVKQKQIQKQVDYKAREVAQKPVTQKMVQESLHYTPQINRIEQNQMSANLKTYLQQPVYDRLTQKYVTGKQQQSTRQQQVQTPQVDFSQFLNRQQELLNKKQEKLKHQQQMQEQTYRQELEKPKINKQSELYLKYRSLLNVNAKNEEKQQYTSKGPLIQHQDAFLNSNYARGAVKQYKGKIW